jgi:hypothetical protein
MLFVGEDIPQVPATVGMGGNCGNSQTGVVIAVKRDLGILWNLSGTNRLKIVN